MNDTMPTTRVMSGQISHVPRRSVSWSRRTLTARPGNSNAKLAMELIVSSKTEVTLCTITANSVHHQNSEREARPLNVT